VDRRAADLDAVLERLTLRVDAGERGQQGRVNIQNPIWKCVEKR
jgi:hypothetical protein